MIVWLTEPFCQCYSWTEGEARWRSKTKMKRRCVWCAADRPKFRLTR
jgi:hypothetical protein